MHVRPAQFLRTHWMTSVPTFNVSNKNNNYKISLLHIAMLFSMRPASVLNAYCARPWRTCQKQAFRPRQTKESTIAVRADPCQRPSASSAPTGGSNALNHCPATPASPSASAGQPAPAAVLPSSTHTRDATLDGCRLRSHHKPHHEHMSRRTGPTVAGFRNHPATEL